MPAADYSSYHQATGTTSDGTKFGNFIDAVQATVNGLDQNNFAAGKIFDPTKIQQDGAVSGQVLGWNGTNWAPGTRLLTGRVASAGTITAGTGFTVVKSATGQYDVTISTAFSAAPIVLPVSEAGLDGGTSISGAVTTSTFRVLTFNTTTGAALDTAWSFVAISIS